MVSLVHAGESLHAVAARFNVSVNTVGLWAKRAAGLRLDRVDFSSRKPGCKRAWNRLAPKVEQHIIDLRGTLREESVLGEYGARAIERELQAEMGVHAPSVATINRALQRHGLQDGAGRTRRAPPPKGWYLPAVAAADSDLDSFDLIEELTHRSII